MKDNTLWFATSIAWTLVLLGATFFAIFAGKVEVASIGGLFQFILSIGFGPVIANQRPVHLGSPLSRTKI